MKKLFDNLNKCKLNKVNIPYNEELIKKLHIIMHLNLNLLCVYLYIYRRLMVKQLNGKHLECIQMMVNTLNF